MYLLVAAVMIVSPATAFARGTYQEPADFVAEAFAGEPPGASRLWITRDLKPGIKAILGHDLGVLRLRYWGQSERTVWVLEEIGKEQPITTGIIVNRGKIERVKILVFRESRGWEVRYPFFTDQFKDQLLTDAQRLSGHIDNISGATLSVRAIGKLARLALWLHQQTEFAHVAP